MTMQAISVRAISSLLAHHANERLTKLRLAFPEYPELFDSRYPLGDKPSAVALDSRKSEAICALINDGLDTVNGRIPIIIRALSHRLKNIRRVKLAGSSVAALSSAGVISALAISNPTVAFVSGILGFLSSLASLIGDHLEKPLVGEQKSTGEYLRQMLEADAASRALSIDLRLGANDPLRMAGKVNEIAAVVRSVEVYCGL